MSCCAPRQEGSKAIVAKRPVHQWWRRSRLRQWILDRWTACGSVGRHASRAGVRDGDSGICLPQPASAPISSAGSSWGGLTACRSGRSRRSSRLSAPRSSYMSRGAAVPSTGCSTSGTPRSRAQSSSGCAATAGTSRSRSRTRCTRNGARSTCSAGTQRAVPLSWPRSRQSSPRSRRRSGADAKVRLARKVAMERFGWAVQAVGRLLVLPDSTTARRQVHRHRLTLGAALPSRGAAVREWLRHPLGSLAGVLFLPFPQAVRLTQSATTSKRVRPSSRVRGTTPASVDAAACAAGPSCPLPSSRPPGAVSSGSTRQVTRDWPAFSARSASAATPRSVAVLAREASAAPSSSGVVISSRVPRRRSATVSGDFVGSSSVVSRILFVPERD